ncbi:histo-blood group ABO system transferase-like isoform X2 [Protopterus annectens]|uniref:histo-blood group ABO system transferase-like isoform X2 n=1 Tax=Protopterus annectens TaxID=7888 RepID=UPI001CF93FF2|nr:histo-blood group ABO system transferase-like isoform X2 [Protopterus annectens]
MNQWKKRGTVIFVVFLLLLLASIWFHAVLKNSHRPFNFFRFHAAFQSARTSFLFSEKTAGDDASNEKADCHNSLNKDMLPFPYLPRMIYEKPQAMQQRRPDVNVLTPWLAPIIWEGTYNYEILNEEFKQGNYSIGLVTFAIKKYTRFLKEFLTTAELYFMLGHCVHYYIFTDRPQDIPNITLKENRFIHAINAVPHKRWQDILFERMRNIQILTEEKFSKEVDYLVSTDIDMKFNDYVGVEVLGNLAVTIHLGYYGSERSDFPYERRQVSEAYIPKDEGDFYYSAAFYSGTVKDMYLLAKACAEGIDKDKQKGIEAVWHEESHFNKYLLYHKPSKVLSPEYTWDNNYGTPSFLKKKCFIAVPKNHNEIRN